MYAKAKSETRQPDTYVLCDPLVWEYVNHTCGNTVKQWEAAQDKGAFTKLQLKPDEWRSDHRERENLIYEINKVGCVEVDNELLSKIEGKDCPKFPIRRRYDSIVKVAGAKGEIESLKKKIDGITNKQNEDKKESSNKKASKSGVSILCDGLTWEFIRIKNDDLYKKIYKTTESKIRGDFVELNFRVAAETVEVKESLMKLIDKAKSQSERITVDQKLFDSVPKDKLGKFVVKSSSNSSMVVVFGDTADIARLKSITNLKINCNNLLWAYIDEFRYEQVDKIVTKFNVIIQEATITGTSAEINIDIGKANEPSNPIKAKQEIEQIIALTKKEVFTFDISKETYEIPNVKQIIKSREVVLSKPLWSNNNKIFQVAGTHEAIQALLDVISSPEKIPGANTTASHTPSENDGQQNKRNATNVTESMHAKSGIPKLDRDQQDDQGVSRDIDKNRTKGSPKGKAPSLPQAQRDTTADRQEKEALNISSNADKTPTMKPSKTCGSGIAETKSSNKTMPKATHEEERLKITQQAKQPPKTSERKSADNETSGTKVFETSASPNITDDPKLSNNSKQQKPTAQSGVKKDNQDARPKVQKAKMTEQRLMKNESKETEIAPNVDKSMTPVHSISHNANSKNRTPGNTPQEQLGKNQEPKATGIRSKTEPLEAKPNNKAPHASALGQTSKVQEPNAASIGHNEGTRNNTPSDGTPGASTKRSNNTENEHGKETRETAL